MICRDRAAIRCAEPEVGRLHPWFQAKHLIRSSNSACRGSDSESFSFQFPVPLPDGKGLPVIIFGTGRNRPLSNSKQATLHAEVNGGGGSPTYITLCRGRPRHP